MKLLLLLIVSCTSLSNLDKAYSKDWDGIIAMREGKDESLTILLKTYGKSGEFEPGKKDYSSRSMIGAIVDEFTKEDKQEAEQKIIAAVKDYIQYDKLNTDDEGLDTIHRIIRKGYRDLFELYLQQKLNEIKSAEMRCKYKYIYTAIEVEDEYFIKKFIDLVGIQNIDLDPDYLNIFSYALIRCKPKSLEFLITLDITKLPIRPYEYIELSKISIDLKKRLIDKICKNRKELKEFISHYEYEPRQASFDEYTKSLESLSKNMDYIKIETYGYSKRSPLELNIYAHKSFIPFSEEFLKLRKVGNEIMEERIEEDKKRKAEFEQNKYKDSMLEVAPQKILSRSEKIKNIFKNKIRRA